MDINISEGVELDDCDTEMALASANALRITSDYLKCLPHFGKLTKVSALIVMGRSVISLRGFDALAEVVSLNLSYNGDLTDLSALKGLRVISGSVQISDNAALTSPGPLLNPALYPEAKGANPTFCIVRNPRVPPQEAEQLIQILGRKGWTNKNC